MKKANYSEMFTNSVLLSLKKITKGVDIDSLDEETKMKFMYIALEDSQKKMDEFTNQYRSYAHKREVFQKHILQEV